MTPPPITSCQGFLDNSTLGEPYPTLAAIRSMQALSSASAEAHAGHTDSPSYEPDPEDGDAPVMAQHDDECDCYRCHMRWLRERNT